MRSVAVQNGPGAFGVAASIGPHTLLLDEPVAEGGDDAGPTPREALLASLGACTSATVKLYARRKGWPIDDVVVELSLTAEPGKKARIDKRVIITGALDAEQLKRCYEIAGKCPVHKMLVEGVDLLEQHG